MRLLLKCYELKRKTFSYNAKKTEMLLMVTMNAAPGSSSHSLPLEGSKMRFELLWRVSVERESRFLYAAMRLCSCNCPNILNQKRSLLSILSIVAWMSVHFILQRRFFLESSGQLFH